MRIRDNTKETPWYYQKALILRQKILNWDPYHSTIQIEWFQGRKEPDGLADIMHSIIAWIKIFDAHEIERYEFKLIDSTSLHMGIDQVMIRIWSVSDPASSLITK